MGALVKLRCYVCRKLVDREQTRRVGFRRVENSRHSQRVTACVDCSKALAVANTIEPVARVGDTEIVPRTLRVLKKLDRRWRR